MHENRVRDRKYGYVDPKKQEALQERAVRDRLAETTAQQKKEGTNTGEGQEVEGATPTTGKEKTAEEKQADRERYWRYLL